MIELTEHDNTRTRKSPGDRRSELNAPQQTQNSGRPVKKERNLNKYDSNSIDEEEF